MGFGGKVGVVGDRFLAEEDGDVNGVFLHDVDQLLVNRLTFGLIGGASIEPSVVMLL